jgi:hypothetical protein
MAALLAAALLAGTVVGAVLAGLAQSAAASGAGTANQVSELKNRGWAHQALDSAGFEH